ncbi:MAG: family efflux transporter subunit, HlyD family secretion protein [Candidatus Taylorbacteria bacterium]|nr:family efflux transporter subunit, HlyD family secretion protein [Candidatus Taylorbacteria bacterium]
MKKHIHSIREYIAAHKVLSAVIVLAAIFGGYKIINAYAGTAVKTAYVSAVVQKNTIISSISGSGQVSASNEVDLKSKASGNIVYIGVKSGQEVAAGDLIARVDARSAEIDLESARIAYQKLTKPADAETLLQKQNDLAAANESQRKSADNLANDYNNALAAAAGSFVDMPSIIDGMRTSFYSSNGFLTDQNLGSVGQNIKDTRDQAGVAFDIALRKYNANLSHYQQISASSGTTSIESLSIETFETVRALAIAVKDAKAVADAIQSANTYNTSGLASFQTSVNSWTSKVNSDLTNISNANTSIANDKSSLASSATSVAEKSESLKKLQSGADPLDVASQQLSLKQKQYAYDDSFIRAPFDGVIAKVSVKLTDTVSSGASVSTLITKQKIATVTLNEVDVSKIKVGDKVTLTFDAIDGLSITGSVSEIDGVGTVTQGVVNYGVKIAFDTQDERVKSGMSVSAAIITGVKSDVISVPNAAVKSANGTSYVEMFTSSSTPPTQRTVEIGIANDTLTEITSGLKEGEQIVTRTITTGATKAAAAPNILSAVGGRAAGAGGANRGGLQGR